MNRIGGREIDGGLQLLEVQEHSGLQLLEVQEYDIIQVSALGSSEEAEQEAH